MNRYISRILNHIISQDFFHILTDKQYLCLMYRIKLGQKLNLIHPVTFNEKIQWLKLNEQSEKYIPMVDKLAVRELACDIMGSDHVVPLLGVWDCFDNICFDELPEQFVLKCNHDSGSTVICTDKQSFDYGKAKKKTDACLKRNYYYQGREWPYSRVERKVFAEQYVKETDDFADYKIYCFNATPGFIVRHQKTSNGIAMDFYDLDWNLMPVGKSHHPRHEIPSQRPVFLSEMLTYAQRFSDGTKFLRVDFYETLGQLFFGELTLFPSSGFNSFVPGEYDRIFGDMLQL